MKKKKELESGQNVFTKISCKILVITEGSCEIALALVKKLRLSLIEKKLLSPVSTYLQDVFVIKVLKGKQMKYPS